MKNNEQPFQSRQGDIFIEQIGEIPATAIKQKKSARIILAHGTATGHHHHLEVQKPVLWFKQGEIPSTKAKAPNLAGEVYISLLTGGRVKHDEHYVHILAAGNFRVTRAREYHPEAIRNVED